MFVILTYDVEAKRNAKVLKTCRKCLVHVQKSVFEGFISAKQYDRLKVSLKNIIDPSRDQIALYRLGGNGIIEKEVIGQGVSFGNIL